MDNFRRKILSNDDILYEYVTIGGIQWSTKNIGAEKETDSGLYFQWGDTKGYKSSTLRYFTWSTYKYSLNGTSTMTKYNSTDGLTILEASDDAATVNMGNNWRMPTTTEYELLLNNSTLTFTDDYNGSGISGIIFTSKADENVKLFFPYTGYMYSRVYYSNTSRLDVWTSERGTSPLYGRLFDGNSLNNGINRYYGYVIRGIYSIFPFYIPPTPRTQYYSGSDLDLLKAGECTWGTIYYSKNNLDWSTSIPKEKYAGDYISYWKIVSNEYGETPSATIYSTIEKSKVGFVRYPVEKRLTYNGSLQTLIIDGWTNVSSTKYYKLGDDGSWSTTAPQASAIGTYYVYFKLVPTDSNRAESETICLRVNIVNSFDYNSHDYVDFGLPSGTLWAKMNVGASNETDSGNYYLYGKGTATYEETRGQTGCVVTEKPLDLSLDTAHQVLGGSWEMPSIGQFDELKSYATCTKTTINGIEGIKVTRTNSSDYIFFPYTGYYPASTTLTTSRNYLWATTQSLSSSTTVLCPTLNTSASYITVGAAFITNTYGLPVRGVIG